MLARAHEKFPHVLAEKVGLQEMDYREAFDGALCIDALEMVAPEDWPLVLSNLNRALKPGGHLYFTVELAAAQDIEKAFIEGRQLIAHPLGNGPRRVDIMMFGLRMVFITFTQR
jgi:cyclopropane fatty-acyl-phospholipid synthase-like methyltransferase